jgi:hypothetical protein
MNPDCGVPRIIDFLNLWARELTSIDHLLMVRYEDIRIQPEKELRRIIKFLGMDPDDERIRETIEFSSIENLRKLEKENYFQRGSRVKAKDSSNPDSFKVRRAKVGGYRDYFDDEQVATIDELVNTRLSGVFGYATEESAAPGTVTAGKAAAEG